MCLEWQNTNRELQSEHTAHYPWAQSILNLFETKKQTISEYLVQATEVCWCVLLSCQVNEKNTVRHAKESRKLRHEKRKKSCKSFTNSINQKPPNCFRLTRGNLIMEHQHIALAQIYAIQSASRLPNEIMYGPYTRSVRKCLPSTHEYWLLTFSMLRIENMQWFPRGLTHATAQGWVQNSRRRYFTELSSSQWINTARTANTRITKITNSHA